MPPRASIEPPPGIAPTSGSTRSATRRRSHGCSCGWPVLRFLHDPCCPCQHDTADGRRMATKTRQSRICTLSHPHLQHGLGLGCRIFQLLVMQDTLYLFYLARRGRLQATCSSLSSAGHQLILKIYFTQHKAGKLPGERLLLRRSCPDVV